MVNKGLIFTLINLLLISCNPTKVEKLNNETNEMSKIEVWSDDKKNEADKLRSEGLNKVEISEEGFLVISKYVIQLVQTFANFNEIDPILGKKERMQSKDFKDPYISYHYVQIPNYPEIEVYLKYRKKDNKLIFISLGYPGSAGGLSFSEYKLRTLDQLNLKVIKKSSLYYSNQLFEYQLTDGKLRYEVYGKDNIDNEPPKEFYIFRIYLD